MSKVAEPFLDFYTYEKIGTGGPEAQSELDALWNRLHKPTDANRYRTSCAVPYTEPPGGGYTVIDVLPELLGLPLCDLVMAYVRALRPSCVRISRGEQTTDARCWRVSITVDEHDVVQSIEQEVQVGYGTGYDVGQCLRAAKLGTLPRACSGVFMSESVLRAEF